MDQTEVSQRHYADFLAASVSPDSQAHELCDATRNPSFVPVVFDHCRAGAPPDLGDRICGPTAFDPEAKPDEPVVCVDFCDAVAFCAHAGKRLCGAAARSAKVTEFNGEGGAGTGEGDAGTTVGPETSHWYNACTAGGSRTRPYPASFDIERCAGSATIGSRPECATEGTSGAVYDLMGGVGEWQDSCSGRTCSVRGGMFGVGPERGSCDQTGLMGGVSRWVGFRCCLDLAPAPTTGGSM